MVTTFKWLYSCTHVKYTDTTTTVSLPWKTRMFYGHGRVAACGLWRGGDVLVARSCPTPCNPMDCSLCRWNSPDKNTGVGCHSLLQGVFLTQGLNQRLMSPALAGGFFTTSTIWEVVGEIIWNWKVVPPEAKRNWRASWWKRRVKKLA